MKPADRWQLKLSAKEQLRGKWGTMALRTFLLMLIPIGIIFAGAMLCLIFSVADAVANGFNTTNLQVELSTATSVIFAVVMTVIYIIAVFSGSFLGLGFSKSCIKIRSGEVSTTSDLFSAFSMGLKAVKLLIFIILPYVPYIIVTIINTAYLSAALSVLELVLWFLGLYIALKISMSQYILLENPYTTAWQAVRQSWNMMRGHCFRYFILMLSFFGWAILAGLSVVGVLWLEPYIVMTNVNFYYDLKQYLLNKNTQIG